MTFNMTRPRFVEVLLEDAEHFLSWALGCKFVKNESQGLGAIFKFAPPHFVVLGGATEPTPSANKMFSIEEPNSLDSKLAVIIGIAVVIAVLFYISESLMNFYHNIFTYEPNSCTPTPQNMSPSTSRRDKLILSNPTMSSTGRVGPVQMNEPVNCVYIRPSTPVSVTDNTRLDVFKSEIESKISTGEKGDSPVDRSVPDTDKIGTTHTKEVTMTATEKEETTLWKKLCGITNSSKGKQPKQHDDDTFDMDSTSDEEAKRAKETEAGAANSKRASSNASTPVRSKTDQSPVRSYDNFELRSPHGRRPAGAECDVSSESLSIDVAELLRMAFLSGFPPADASPEDIRQLTADLGVDSEEESVEEGTHEASRDDVASSNQSYNEQRLERFVNSSHDEIDSVWAVAEREDEYVQHETHDDDNDGEKFDILIEECPLLADTDTCATGCVRVGAEYGGRATVLFRWTDAATQMVSLTGSFFGWSLSLPLNRGQNGSSFSLSLVLNEGLHEYRMDIYTDTLKMFPSSST